MLNRNTPPLRVYFNEKLGWCVDVPAPLSSQMVKAATDWAYKMNLDRWKGMMPGDRKDRLGAALPALRAGRVHQVVKGQTFEIGTD